MLTYDLAIWCCKIKIYNDLNLYDKGDLIEEGHITWQVQNLHVYERHFHLVN